MEIQDLLGADIQMQFDECVKLPCRGRGGARAPCSCRCAGPSARKRAFARAARPRAVRHRAGRRRSDRCGSRARGRWSRSDFDGYAHRRPRGRRTAGRHAGDDRRDGAALPAGKPRYLMGVGAPDDLVEAVRARHRHVRLRDADAGRAARPRLHALGKAQSAQRMPCRRPGAGRRRFSQRRRRALIPAPIFITSSNPARFSA